MVPQIAAAPAAKGLSHGSGRPVQGVGGAFAQSLEAALRLEATRGAAKPSEKHGTAVAAGAAFSLPQLHVPVASGMAGDPRASSAIANALPGEPHGTSAIVAEGKAAGKDSAATPEAHAAGAHANSSGVRGEPPVATAADRSATPARDASSPEAAHRPAGSNAATAATPDSARPPATTAHVSGMTRSVGETPVASPSVDARPVSPASARALPATPPTSATPTVVATVSKAHDAPPAPTTHRAAPAALATKSQASTRAASQTSGGARPDATKVGNAFEPAAGMAGSRGEFHQIPTNGAAQATQGMTAQTGQTLAAPQPTGLSREVSVQIAAAARVEAPHVQSGGASLVRIALSPPELGHVSVTLRAGADGLSATLRAEQPAAAALLQQGQGELRQRLEALGLGKAHIEVSSYDPKGSVRPARRSSPGRRN